VKNKVTKHASIIAFLVLSFSVFSLTPAYASSMTSGSNTAPAAIQQNEPVYKSPTLESGQTGSNGQSLTAAQAEQQVKSYSHVQWGHIILVVVVLLVIIAVIVGIIVKKKKKSVSAPISQRPVTPNPINPPANFTQPNPQLGGQPPVQPFPQQPQAPQPPDPNQNNLPPSQPSV